MEFGLDLYPWYLSIDVLGTTFPSSGQMVDSDVCLMGSDIMDKGWHQDDDHTKSYTASNSIL